MKWGWARRSRRYLGRQNSSPHIWNILKSTTWIWKTQPFKKYWRFSCSLSCSFLLSLFDHSNPSDLLLLWTSIAEFSLSFNTMKCFVSLVVVGSDLNWTVNWRTRTTDVSLVVRWLTVCLLRLGTWVWSLVWEPGSYVSRGDWVPMRQRLIPWATITETCAPRVHALQREARVLQLESSSCSLQLQKAHASNEHLMQPKINI